MHDEDRTENGDDQDDTVRTGSVVKDKKEAFMALLAAAQMGQLGLVKATIASTGEEVAVICAVFKEESGYNMFPLGHMCNEDPFNYYIPDLKDIKNEGVIM